MNTATCDPRCGTFDSAGTQFLCSDECFMAILRAHPGYDPEADARSAHAARMGHDLPMIERRRQALADLLLGVAPATGPQELLRRVETQPQQEAS